MHPTLQWLDSPNRPMRYYGGPVNLMSFLQQAYFSEEKINLIYVATLGIPTNPLHRRTSRSTGKGRCLVLDIEPKIFSVDNFPGHLVRDIFRAYTLAQL